MAPTGATTGPSRRLDPDAAEVHAATPSIRRATPLQQRPSYDRSMAQLRVTIRVLSAALLALLARIVVDGVTIADGLAEALIVVLLIASVGLWRYGRRLASEPPQRPA